MTKKRVIILGAGLSGLSAAWHLRKKGHNCLVFEKETEAGGLCRSKSAKGFTFDYDGHLLHFRSPYAFNFVKLLLGDNLAQHQRSAWVYSNKSYIHYPFQANLCGLPFPIIEECLLEFIKAGRNGRHKKKNNITFLDWIYRTFGKGIARHFMIPYNTKFWTLPPGQLTCEWLDGFIPVPSLTQAVEGAFGRSKEEFGYNAHFWYPKKGGIAELPLALASRIKNIYTNSNITRIDIDKKEIEINSCHKERFDYLVSTLPLPELPRLIGKLPGKIHSLFNKLRWNSIFNLNLGVEGRKEPGRHWIYFPERDLSFFRVGFPHNFSSSLAPGGTSSLYAEVSYSENKPIDKKKIISDIKDDLKKTGLIGEGDKVYMQDKNDIKYAYPIYDGNYSAARKNILSFLSQNCIMPCGRYGSWRYMSMEDSILDGKKQAESF